MANHGLGGSLHFENPNRFGAPQSFLDLQPSQDQYAGGGHGPFMCRRVKGPLEGMSAPLSRLGHSCLPMT